MTGQPPGEVLFLGGRSGVGKSSVGAEIHAQLSAADVRHALIEGDNLDQAHPPPWEHSLAERNLTAMWANYRALGYHRLIYTNTVSVRFTDTLTAAMGDHPRITAVLLTATDSTTHARLAQREIGTALQTHIARSNRAAPELAALSPPWVHRVPTDNRRVTDIATQILTLTGWLPTTPTTDPATPIHPAATAGRAAVDPAGSVVGGSDVDSARGVACRPTRG